MEKTNYFSTYKISTTRLKALCDGVIAIVMTLLILDIKLPISMSNVSNRNLALALVDILPSIFAYILSFLLIARYWVIHNYLFIHFKKGEGVVIWGNILFLLTLSFLPFPTELLGSYPHNQLAVILFDISISLPSLTLLLILYYVSHSKKYAAEFESNTFSQIRTRKFLDRLLPIPIMAIVSIGASFVLMPIAVYIWVLFLFITPIGRWFERRKGLVVESEPDD